MRALLASLIASASLATLSVAAAAPIQVRTPNVSTAAGAVSVVLNGKTFVNQGLQGVARLPASTVDFSGDTFGAFSSLDVRPGTWRRNADGTYGGLLYALPDRGPNGIGSVTFSNYAGRTSAFLMNLTPYTGTANLPANASSQQQLKLTPQGGMFFKDFVGALTTGLDPGAPGPNAFITQNGINLPGSKTGAAAGKISLDAEGLRFLNDGSFYVSDEYGANVYYFSDTGNLLGVILPPAALIPRTGATDTSPNSLSYTSLTDAVVGRRLNQGIEGMDVTPDGKRLVTLLQSATMQDSTSAQQTRTNTRLMIYDISGTRTPTTPIEDYVIQLPTYRSNGDGGAVDRTAAQSEILALNATQFLVLARDANGLGQANLPFVYKSVLLIDTAGATNIAGTAYENSYTPISPGGVLNTSITPVSQVEVVNILNSTQLTKFGISLNNTAPASSLTLTEKWEGMALLPVLEEGAPQDFFLLIGNDNDFLSQTCNVGGQNCAQGVNSDAVILTYRLTLPTYVDSEYLAAMLVTAPITADMARDTAVSLSGSVAQQTFDYLNAGRRVSLTGGPASAGGKLWGTVDWRHGSDVDAGLLSYDSGDQFDGSIGYDFAVADGARLGVALNYSHTDQELAFGFGSKGKAFTGAVYGGYEANGFFVDALVGYSLIDLTSLSRPGAYGLMASGETDADGWVGSLDAGYLFPIADQVYAGPVASLNWSHLSIDGYTEVGASGGNIRYAEEKFDTLNYAFGAEAIGKLDTVTPSLRVVYTWRDADDAVLPVTLASALDPMATQNVFTGGASGDSVTVSLGLQTGDDHAMWFVGYDADIGVGDDRSGVEHRITLGGSVNF
ncbi:hypothetical protein sos41_16550 [Alphaproteobacteria bacterium SO-S41]|nr:hypothetical protein sos41_16550 [Alphaproteobacteria bacterium SO-S41]